MMRNSNAAMARTAQIDLFTYLENILLQIFELPELVLFTSNRFTMVVAAGLVVLYLVYKRRVTIYLLDFTCYQPPAFSRMPHSMFLEYAYLDNQMDADSLSFQVKITEKSGFSEETGIPDCMTLLPIGKSLSYAREEAELVIFSTVSDLFKKNNIDPKSIDILIINSSMVSPTPSLSAMVVNKFRMRSNIMTFNLSGMGCSAGILSVSLAKDLLRVRRNSLAVIVSTELLNVNRYTGKDPSMLLTNCLFRTGGAAILLSSRDQDKRKAKYELQHLVRTNNAKDDQSYNCVFQDVDSEMKLGVSISKDTVKVAGDALKTNIRSLGPLVLPFSEQFRYGVSIICRKMRIQSRLSFCMPDFKKAFDHFCIHAGGRAIIRGIKKNLQLRDVDVEASKMTLYRFGNTSSSSIWYELCYIETKGRMKKGHRVWQIAFGSGFKCNSAVWKCVHNVERKETTAWSDRINSYPLEIPTAVKIDMN
ncbi:hypothetical protein LWI28_009491 [Acer negundo]|uniref:3-ketoacyl-CoA synthase n=1 Tax=Acer negundo TaxID=4023 RepID=A0AAD5JJT5_ACENE|nr:hypothetical protein LWI28_009491 [Acer negundo]